MKIFRRVLITLVVLAAVVALGDRVANALAERRIADEVAATAADHGAHSDQRPDVKIHDWPFLTQAWGGEFAQIDITLHDVGANDLVFPELTMVARNVEADWRELSDGGQVIARTLDLEGTISIESVEALLAEQTGLDLEIDDDGTAVVNATREIAGFTIELRATGQIEIADGALSYRPDAVESLTSSLPAQVESQIDQFAAELGTTIGLPELPYGIVLADVSFKDGALTVAASAEDVVLN